MTANAFELKIARHEGRTDVEIHEGQTWDKARNPVAGGTSRPTLVVEVYHPREAYGALQGAEVSWPSTSDRRPELAVMLARALDAAYAEARILNLDAGLPEPELPRRTYRPTRLQAPTGYRP